MYCCSCQLFYPTRIVSPGRNIYDDQFPATFGMPAGEVHRYFPAHTVPKDCRLFQPIGLHIPPHIVRHRYQGHICTAETPPMPPQIEGMHLKPAPGQHRSQRSPIGRQAEHPVQQNGRTAMTISLRMEYFTFSHYFPILAQNWATTTEAATAALRLSACCSSPNRGMVRRLPTVAATAGLIPLASFPITIIPSGFRSARKISSPSKNVP